jgi:hypothetical protein
VKRGQVVFGAHAFPMIAALFAASLPEAYASAKGALVLAATDRLERDVDARILETAQFLVDVMSEGGLDPTEDPDDDHDDHATGRGIRTAQKVRLIHAAVRLLIDRRCPLDPADGRPINQEDLAGTLMTFSVVVLEACRVLRVEIGAEQQEDFLYAWRVVGHLLGIDPRLVPRNILEARTLMTRIRRRQHASSEHGRLLTSRLLASMSRNLPFFVPRALPAVLVRQLVGDEVANLLAVPDHPFWRRMTERVFGAADRYGWFEGHPSTSRRLARLHMFMVTRMLTSRRKGKNVDFRLPIALGH